MTVFLTYLKGLDMKDLTTITSNNAIITTIGERVAMHIRIVRFGILVLMLCLYCFCQKSGKNDTLLKIKGKTMTRTEFNSFLSAKNLYPEPRGDFFSRPLADMTFFVDMEAFYDKANATPFAAKAKSSDDWKWKKMYFPASIYIRNVLQGNMGFSDKEIEAYYKAHRESYTRRVPRDTTPPDTLHKKQVKNAKIDSVKVYIPLDEVRIRIIDTMFVMKYPPPDSLFRKNPKDTAKMDSAGIINNWLFNTKRTAQEFFLRKFYEVKFKTKLPDSLNQFYGEKKIITPSDMKVITSWIPEDQRGYYSSPSGTMELAKWLLRWKLFSEKAQKTWDDPQGEIKAELQWAWKMNVVFNYVNTQLLPNAKKAVALDTAMCVYAYWDDKGNPSVKPDSSGFKSTLDQYAQRVVNMDIDRQIFELRKKMNIVIVQNDYKDDGSGNPTAMIVHADSLRDTGKTDEAERIYETLIFGFSYTPEGLRSMVELAKIQTEKQAYAQAIKNYRDYLVFSNDKSKRCNTFFMIGFIYDEYLSKPDQASANYRWVLKNTPDCELSDDAEFMSLHLGEAMNSVEELRAEAMRQGKKVDTSAIQEPVVDTAKKVKAK